MSQYVYGEFIMEHLLTRADRKTGISSIGFPKYAMMKSKILRKRIVPLKLAAGFSSHQNTPIGKPHQGRYFGCMVLWGVGNRCFAQRLSTILRATVNKIHPTLMPIGTFNSATKTRNESRT